MTWGPDAADEDPLDALDPIYFADKPWDERVADWEASVAGHRFSAGNEQVVRTAIDDPDAGLCVVVNLGVTALLGLLPDGRYLNLYERPVIGGEAREGSPERVTVDEALGVRGKDVYFAAVALGGAGVRYYGEYCLVLRLDRVDPDPHLLDRDSYDLLLDPLDGVRDRVVERLEGWWSTDRRAMVLMKVLPEVAHDHRLVTTGTVSEMVLKDQEFIEVHLVPDRPPGVRGGFGRDAVEEVRESPDEVAVATRLRERAEDGQLLSDVEDEWLRRRECATRVIAKAKLPSRVVTHHGKGYQWK